MVALSVVMSDGIDDDLSDEWPANGLPPVTMVLLLRREMTVPAENGVGSEQRSDFFEPLASEHLCFDRQVSPLIITQQDARSARFLLQALILGPQVVDHKLLLPTDPEPARIRK